MFCHVASFVQWKCPKSKKTKTKRSERKTKNNPMFFCDSWKSWTELKHTPLSFRSAWWMRHEWLLELFLFTINIHKPYWTIDKNQLSTCKNPPMSWSWETTKHYQYDKATPNWHFVALQSIQRMANWWFGARWLGFLRSPYEKDSHSRATPKSPIYHSQLHVSNMYHKFKAIYK